METTEKIVESYCRYVKHWFTISNLRQKNDEIDILAIDTSGEKIKKYHIEVSVSISKSFSKLTGKKFDEEKYRTSSKASQRRTIGFFIEKKFNKKEFEPILDDLGFSRGSYKKVIVSWGWNKEAEKIAKENNIELWDFRELISEIGSKFENSSSYFGDDILRTIQLFQLSKK